jgi:hypothetical protein
MNRPWYAPLVVIFWLVTTGWLFTSKILPSLLPGAPPGYQARFTADGRAVPVAWSVILDDKPLGWSLSRAERLAGGAMRVESLLHFDHLPIGQLLPSWTRLLVRQSIPDSAVLALDATGRMEIDRDGHLTSFSSVIDMPGNDGKILLSGTVDDGEVTIVIRSGEMVYESKRFLPETMMLGDELSPHASLPGLVLGRQWTVPVYSPLRPAQSPIEILHAEVEGSETIFWEDHLVTVDVVSYRDDPASHREPRARLWVDRSGRVLRQEATTMGRKIHFERRSDAAAETLAENLAELVEPKVPDAAPEGEEAGGSP